METLFETVSPNNANTMISDKSQPRRAVLSSMLKKDASQSGTSSEWPKPVVMTACHLQCGKNFLLARKHWVGMEAP